MIDYSLISQIAYEKLCEGDPDKALDFVLECIPGMPEDLALTVVAGKGWLKPTDNDQMVNYTTTRPEGYFETPDMTWLLQHRMDDMQSGLMYMLTAMSDLKSRIYIKNISTDDFYVSDLKYARNMMKDNPSDKSEEWYCGALDGTGHAKALAQVIYLYKNMKYFIRDYKKSYRIWSWGREMLGIRPVKDSLFFEKLGALLKDFNQIKVDDKTINSALKKLQKEWLPIINDDDLLHSSYNDEILECNIMDGYDAGWLSPDGKFYGSDGPTSALIHINIASRLEKDDIELEKEGWVKIHHYECYSFLNCFKDEHCSDTIKNPDGTPWNGYVWSDKQLKLICDYIDKFYNRVVYTRALSSRHFNTSELKAMDIIALHNALEI